MSASIHISLAAENVLHLGPLAVSNSMLAGLVGSLLIFGVLLVSAKKAAQKPMSKFALAFDTGADAILTLIDGVTHNRAKSIRFFPLLMTLFLFILFNNWLGLLPGFGSITIGTAEGPAPLFRGATADLNTTLALAIISIVMTQVYAVKELGLFKHLGKYFSLNPILFFVGMLELVGEFSKMLSFSFRLFGNIFAGEVLLTVIAYLAPALAPLPFFGLELFVGLVQALVFTMLTLVFLEIATSEHGDHAEPAQQGEARPDGRHPAAGGEAQLHGA